MNMSRDTGQPLEQNTVRPSTLVNFDRRHDRHDHEIWSRQYWTLDLDLDSWYTHGGSYGSGGDSSK
jgi:hypothetical protein